MLAKLFLSKWIGHYNNAALKWYRVLVQHDVAVSAAVGNN